VTPLRVLVIDNYDSFVFNLVQYVGELGADPIAIRHDLVQEALPGLGAVDRVIISPGPGRPEDSPGSMWALSHFSHTTPILGVCLGHQAIAAFFGARIVRAPFVMHGRTSTIIHDHKGIYQTIDASFEATRYHSLVVDPDSVPATLAVTARTEDGIIMGLRHLSLPIEGVQYHPESILSENGHRLLATFLQAATELKEPRH